MIRKQTFAVGVIAALLGASALTLTAWWRSQADQHHDRHRREQRRRRWQWCGNAAEQVAPRAQGCSRR